jgi:hypothetical protein
MITSKINSPPETEIIHLSGIGLIGIVAERWIGSIKSPMASSGSLLKSRENLGADPTFHGEFFNEFLNGPDGSGFTFGFVEGFEVIDGFELSQPLFIAV